jgi:3-deoxy-D-manno-octulosonic-acid transferase
VLNGYYAAADVAFVGGSLLPYGGHNPIEPAAFGSAVIMGSHHASQAEAVRALSQRDGITIVGSEAELGSSLDLLLSDSELRERRGQAAREGAEAQRGAARRTVARLAEWGLWSGV